MKKILIAICVLTALAALSIPALAADSVTLYCKAPEDWTECYVYWWGSSYEVSWPGESMMQDATGTWYYDVPDDATHVIFSNYNGQNYGEHFQSPDLAMKTDGSNTYCVPEKDWEPIERLYTGDPMVDCVKLENGDVLPYQSTLKGTVITVDTPYHEIFQNITVTIAITDYPDRLIRCYRMTGEDAAKVDVGNLITVTGYLEKFDDALQFKHIPAEGYRCELVELHEYTPNPLDDQKRIVDAAFRLSPNEELPYIATLTGQVVEIVTPYDEQYKNITVTIEVEGSDGMQRIVCYRMKGDDAPYISVGDSISVTGTLQRYCRAASEDKPALDRIEFDTGCTFVFNFKPCPTPTPPSDPKQIVDEAFALEPGATLPYEAELTGVVTEIVSEYNSDFRNITVNMEVEGSNGPKIIYCYRLRGENSEKISVGDTITVRGTIKHYANSLSDIDFIEFYGATLVEWIPKDVPDDTDCYIITVKAPLDWDSCYLYAWDDFGTNASWPGIAMTRNANGTWSATLGSNYTGMVFAQQDGGKQTVDLEAPSQSATYVIATQPNADGRFEVDYVTYPPNDDIIGTLSDLCVVGNADWLGNWNPAHDAGRMVVVAPDVYQCSFQDVPPGSYELVITEYGTWSGTKLPTAFFTVTKTCTVTVTYTALDRTIEVTGVGITEETCTEHRFSSYVYNFDARCGVDGTKTAQCDYCDVTQTITAEGTALDHRFDDMQCLYCGKPLPSFTGFRQVNYGLYYFRNGIQSQETGLVKHDGSWFYLKVGRIASETTGLVKYGGEWWYVVHGKVASDTTTLVKYNGEWWYVVKGKVASKTTTLVKYNGEWWYVVKGKIASKTTTLVKFNGGWYYVLKGKVAFKTTTLVKYNGSWYYVNCGVLDRTYTGVYIFNGKAYQIRNGSVV